MKKTILFIHQSFPGQFAHISKKLAQEGHRVAALAVTPQGQLDGVSLIRYSLIRAPQEDLPTLLKETDLKILRAESAALAMRRLKEQGFDPDVVYAHPGWGEAMFVKDVWPDTRLVIYAEWFYSSEGQEVNFDLEFPLISNENQLRLKLKNTTFLHALNDADLAIAPTQWQKSRFPAWAQEKIKVIHDGLDLTHITMGIPKVIKMPGTGESLKYGDPIITFVSRYLEPVRGFHLFMRAIPSILRQRPDAHIMIMGKDAGAQTTGYGQNNPLGKNWRQSLQDEMGNELDMNRVHFLGHVAYNTYLSIMRLSACHVYLTTPFILSWSFLETAAQGVPMVASRTAPVQEFEHLKGLELVDYFDHAALTRKVLDVIGQPIKRTPNYLEDQSLKNVLPKLTDVLIQPKTANNNIGNARQNRKRRKR